MFSGKTLKKKTKPSSYFVLNFLEKQLPWLPCVPLPVDPGFCNTTQGVRNREHPGGISFLYRNSLSPPGLSQCPQRQIYLLTNLGFIVEHQGRGSFKLQALFPNIHLMRMKKNSMPAAGIRWPQNSLLRCFHVSRCHRQLLFFLHRPVFSSSSFFNRLGWGCKVSKGHRLEKEGRSRGEFLPAPGLMELCGRQITRRKRK